eukprot:GHVR01131551.1.p1 GENE.GHVR01131551.1~~GHVR01131551.1.p1  ORF type:complete len:122 (+),score=6.57 GHVR01131551.1:26-391(+)
MLDKCVATYWVVIVFGILCSVTPQLRCFSLHGRFNALGTGNSQVDNFQAWTVPKCLFWCFYGWGLLYHSIVTLALYTAGARVYTYCYVFAYSFDRWERVMAGICCYFTSIEKTSRAVVYIE